MNLLPGTEVRSRGLRWEVVTSESLGQQTLYRLRGLDVAVQGREFDILYPFEEDIEPVRHELQPERAAPLPNWLVYHQAFLLEQALGPNALLAVQPGRLRFEPYQLVPVHRAIRMSRVRLLLADAVGLGKTIQAGLIVTEMIARRMAHRVLIVSPAGPLLEQWRLEMAERFGLRLEVIDRSKLDEIRRGTELGSNPFDHVPLGIVSIDFLKQERILDQLERASYDIVVIDEAHHCMDVGNAVDREDSQRRNMAELLARRSDSLILLTATPHDGNDGSFASLCELLDPSLVDGRGSLRGERYRANVVRRLKKHIVDSRTKQPLFKERIVHPIPVVADPKKHAAFIEMQRQLIGLIAPELKHAFRNKRYDNVLAWIALLKRSVSTVAACGETLGVVADRYQHFLVETAEAQEFRRQRIKSLKDYARKCERFGSTTAEEERDRSLLEAEDLAQQLATLERERRKESRGQRDVSRLIDELEAIRGLADQARERDPKLDCLIATIREIRASEPGANVLVYTEYVDSQRAALGALKEAGFGDVLTMSGEDDDRTRSRITERFRTREGLVLVSTDAAAEGLNLHQRCHHLIHLELPFNPNRLEQRNGRIDRYGQTFEPQVRYLYLRGTFEERILLRLIAKYEKARSRLTFMPNTLGITGSTETGQIRLLKGLMDEDQKLFKEEPTLFDFDQGDENQGADEHTLETLEEIDRSLKGFERAAKTNAWLGDVGLNAEEAQVGEADRARDRGCEAENVDLAQFVCDAVRLDGGQVDGQITDEHFVVHLPTSWLHGLDELPGYNADARVVRLTTRIDVTTVGKDLPVGFLGRAHPLVRRALDRVRNLASGATARTGQDPRASAVRADVPVPTLLFTFLGRLASRAGRELERVLAARVTRDGTLEFLPFASDWYAVTDPKKAIRPTDLWKKEFASWSEEAHRRAGIACGENFEKIAKMFIEERRASLQKEEADQEGWLARRAEEITGQARSSAYVQRGFLDEESKTAIQPKARAAWESVTKPVERLAAFHTDRDQSPAARAQAEGVLQLYKQRKNSLDSLMDLRTPEVVPLGVLMIIPEHSHGT
jgi:superfamily II DNA or RNA helicase